MKILIKNGRVISPASNLDALADVAVAAGRVVAIGAGTQGFVPNRVIDARGCVVAPGLVDLAARLREPGHEHEGMLESDDDEPVVMAIYHQKMLSWALKLAYLKPDADTFDLGLSDKHDEEFTRTFGPPKTAQDHRQRRRRQARSYKTPGY